MVFHYQEQILLQKIGQSEQDDGQDGDLDGLANECVGTELLEELPLVATLWYIGVIVWQQWKPALVELKE